MSEQEHAPTVVIATSTWNNGPIVELFLEHYRALGAAAVIAIDFGSTDGTRELLADRSVDGFVHPLDLPGLAEMRRSTLMLEYAKEHYSPDAWCLFCDPDEFLVAPGMEISSVCVATEGTGALLVPRHNVTALRSKARDADARMLPDGELTLRIDRRQSRGMEALQVTERLEPSWIFTAVPGKVAVRLGAAKEMPLSDHEALLEEGWSATDAAAGYLLHYPFRTFREFVEKVELAMRDFATNEWPEGFGWQYRRWFRARDDGTLFEEYLDQFIDDDDLAALLATGALVEDVSVSRFLRTRGSSSVRREEGC